MTAVPNAGYHFVNWSDGVLTASAHRHERDGERERDSELRDQHLHADLYGRSERHDQRNLTADGQPRCERHAGDSGTEHGLPLRDWSDGVLTAARTDTNVTANVSVTANFAINTYTLTYTAGANGTISGDLTADGQPRCGRL